MEPINNASTVEMTEIIAEFPRACTRFVESSNLLKLSRKAEPGNNLPFVTSTDAFVALTSIQKNGKMDTKATMDKNTYVKIRFALALAIFIITCHFKLDNGQNNDQNYDGVRNRCCISKVW